MQEDEIDVKPHSIPVDEQETTISYGRANNKAVIWTSDRTVMTKLDKLVKSSKRYTLVDTGKVDGYTVSKTYEVDDKSLISFRADKVKQNLTEEQRALRAERMRRNLS